MKIYLGLLALALLTDRSNIILVDAARQRRRRDDSSPQDQSREISSQEVEELTDDNTIIDDADELAKSEMLQEWDNHMQDFVPDDMLTVDLGPREEFVSTLSITISNDKYAYSL